jgi:hypothetical protein
MALHEELDEWRKEIKTDNYAMSIGEWINLYDSGELDVHPEYQRFFRWNNEQKSRFIESILLGIPIPPIFVAQRDDGKWDVVDGLQRLSTVFESAGILKDKNDNVKPPLTLEKTKYLPSLEGKIWESDDPGLALGMAERLFIKRAKFHVNIVLPESHRIAIYELFQRLNTGGTPLSEQEVRNCILVETNPEWFEWFQNLASYDAFKECAILTDRAIDERYDLELVLRFLVFRMIPETQLANLGELGEFLTTRMVEMASSGTFAYEEESTAFQRTFDILRENVENDSFRRYDPARNKHVGGFLITPFEVFAIGIGNNYQTVESSECDIKALIRTFWTDNYPNLPLGGGVRASSRIPITINLGRELFANG